MRVKVFDYDKDGTETLRSECELRECFPDDEEEYHTVFVTLTKDGRYWTGGGAAPLVMLKKVN